MTMTESAITAATMQGIRIFRTIDALSPAERLARCCTIAPDFAIRDELVRGETRRVARWGDRKHGLAGAAVPLDDGATAEAMDRLLVNACLMAMLLRLEGLTV